MKKIQFVDHEVTTLKNALSHYAKDLHHKYQELSKYNCAYIANPVLIQEIRLQKEHLMDHVNTIETIQNLIK